MAWFRSSRRLSLKTILRDATVMLAGTVLGILLSHMFFTDSGGSSTGDRGLDLCADGSNAQLPHLAKRSEENLKHLRSRLAQNHHQAAHVPPPRPLPAVWGDVMSKIEVATGRDREKGTRTLALAAAQLGGDQLEEPSGSGAGTTVDGSGHPQVATNHLEDTTPQTTDSLLPLPAASSSNDIAASTESKRSRSKLPALENSEMDDEVSRLRNSLIIGVHASNLNGYTAVRKTWGSYAQKLVYLSSMKKEEGSEEGDVPLVNLNQGNNDSHTHQLRANAYQLLKFMHDNFINDFGWFMRTNDNVYVRVEHLTDNLAKLDPNREQCFGYPGSGGHKVEYMEGCGVGGPVTIFSRGLLKKLGPHLDQCLRNGSTTNDKDVEKCLRERVEFQCGKNSEISQLFLNDTSRGEIFSHPDTQATYQLLEASVVIYPVPSPSLMFRVHQFYLELAINKLKHRTNQLFSELERLASSMSLSR